MNINSVSAASDYYAQQLSSGSQINSAADNPANAAIAEGMTSQVNGYDQGSQNAANMKNLLDTADGGLAGISDALQRIRELSVQASNGVYGPDDLKNMQDEVQQMLDYINTAAASTQYNNKNLLDGSAVNMNTASSPDGTGQQVSIKTSFTDALGLKDYNVTGKFDISKVDDAISEVDSMRASLGASSNRLDYTIMSDDIGSLNLAASRSFVADTDVAKASTEYNKNKLLMEFQLLAQKRQMEDEKNKVNVLL